MGVSRIKGYTEKTYQVPEGEKFHLSNGMYIEWTWILLLVVDGVPVNGDRKEPNTGEEIIIIAHGAQM